MASRLAQFALAVAVVLRIIAPAKLRASSALVLLIEHWAVQVLRKT